MTTEEIHRLIQQFDEESELPEDDKQRIRMIGFSRMLRIKLKQLEKSLTDEIKTNV